MTQPNGFSTPAPKSSAAKQWIKELAQTNLKTSVETSYMNTDMCIVQVRIITKKLKSYSVDSLEAYSTLRVLNTVIAYTFIRS